MNPSQALTMVFFSTEYGPLKPDFGWSGVLATRSAPAKGKWPGN